MCFGLGPQSLQHAESGPSASKASAHKDRQRVEARSHPSNAPHKYHNGVGGTTKCVPPARKAQRRLFRVAYGVWKSCLFGAVAAARIISQKYSHVYMQTWHEQIVSCKQNELMRSHEIGRYCGCAVCKSLSQCGLGQRYTLAAMLTVSYMDDVTEAARCSSFHTAFGPPVQVGLTLAPLALLV